MTEDQIRDNVNEALRNAKDNGYFMAGTIDVQDVCNDLLRFEPSVEGMEPVQLEPYVKGFFRRSGQYRDPI